MKRVASFLVGAVVVIGVLVLFIVFAHHTGPGDSPRDDNNAKPANATTTRYLGETGPSVRI
jgi:hypothetical protein